MAKIGFSKPDLERRTASQFDIALGAKPTVILILGYKRNIYGLFAARVILLCPRQF
jgi:hypothetical protein